VFVPLPWQVTPWRDMSPILLLTGSAGGGKSILAAEKIHGFMQHYRNATGLVVRKTRESMTNSTVLMLERNIIGQDPFCYHMRSRHRFEYANGSILAYGGMANEEQREQIRSIGAKGGLDFVWMEEANSFVEDDYNEILARMRGNAAPWTQVLLSTNPDYSLHWINKRLILGKEATVYYSQARDNKHNPASYFANLGRLTGVLKERLVEGKWTNAVGNILSNFKKNINVVYRTGPWEYVTAGVDAGYTNPTALIVKGHDGDGRRHIMAEFYQTSTKLKDVVAEAVRLNYDHNVSAWIVDPSAPGLIAELRAAGLNAIAGNNTDVNHANAKINDLLLPAGDGLPRLTVSHDCPHTIAEFESYIWDARREKPAPANNHAMDANRYDEETPISTAESVVIPSSDKPQELELGHELPI